MFFWPIRKKLRTGEKFCFAEYPVATRKGLKLYL
jgi:hypothetical protein